MFDTIEMLRSSAQAFLLTYWPFFLICGGGFAVYMYFNSDDDAEPGDADGDSGGGDGGGGGD